MILEDGWWREHKKTVTITECAEKSNCLVGGINKCTYL